MYVVKYSNKKRDFRGLRITNVWEICRIQRFERGPVLRPTSISFPDYNMDANTWNTYCSIAGCLTMFSGSIRNVNWLEQQKCWVVRRCRLTSRTKLCRSPRVWRMACLSWFLVTMKFSGFLNGRMEAFVRNMWCITRNGFTDIIQFKENGTH
jgi:hypothetical protein